MSNLKNDIREIKHAWESNLKENAVKFCLDKTDMLAADAVEWATEHFLTDDWFFECGVFEVDFYFKKDSQAMAFKLRWI